jgi:hypothetical protein
MRVEFPNSVSVRLGSFVLVLAVAAGAGWLAGQGVGPIQLPPPDAVTHHLESR